MMRSVKYNKKSNSLKNKKGNLESSLNLTVTRNQNQLQIWKEVTQLTRFKNHLANHKSLNSQKSLKVIVNMIINKEKSQTIVRWKVVLSLLSIKILNKRHWKMLEPIKLAYRYQKWVIIQMKMIKALLSGSNFTLLKHKSNQEYQMKIKVEMNTWKKGLMKEYKIEKKGLLMKVVGIQDQQ